MKVNCYMCDDVTIQVAVDSVEHIIPEALGSPLSSTGLLCEKHNNNLGGEVDGELFKQVGHFADMMGFNRRTKVKILNGFDEDNNPYTALSGMKGAFEVELHLQGLKKEPIKIVIKGQTEEEVREKARIAIIKQAKAYPNYEEYLKELENSEFLPKNLKENKFHFRSQMSNDPKKERIVINRLMIKAFIKIAINYYLYNGGDRKQVQQVIDIMKSKTEDIPLSPQLVRVVTPNSVERIPNSDELSHIVSIKGNPEEGYLIAYVELFCYLPVLVFMNLAYKGSQMNFQYGYDLLQKASFTPTVELKISKNDMLNMQFNNDHPKFLSENLERLFSVFNEYQRSKHKDEEHN